MSPRVDIDDKTEIGPEVGSIPAEYEVDIFETNKMRYWLKAVGQSEGMIARHGYYATFYDGMALNIPNYMGIWVQGSDEYLRLYPERLWKDIVIWKVDRNYNEQRDLLKLNILQDGINNIPFVGNIIDDLATLTWDIAWMRKVVASIQVYPVWENVLYKHTLGNNVLMANYNKVRAEIMPLIIKKYGVV